MPTSARSSGAAPAGESAPHPEPWLTRGTFAISATVLFLLVRRLRFGVDLTDEAFYVAMPYRFVRGDTPFVDEILIHQTAALLATPLVAAFVGATGSTDGIVLFLRAAHLVFSLAISGLVAWTLAPWVGRQYAVLIGLVCAAFVPFCIPTLSYNTLGIGFFTGGLLLGSLGLVDPGAWRRAALGGVLLALAVLSYPPLAIAAIVHGVSVAILTPAHARRSALALALAFTLASLCIAALLASYGLDNIAHSIAATAQLGGKGGGAAKLADLGSDALYWIVLQPVPIAVALWLARGARPGAAALPGLVLLMPLTLATVAFEQHATRGLWQILHLGLAAPLLLRIGDLSADERRYCRAILIASATAGCVTAYVSANGLMNAGLGALPAALLGVLALVRASARVFPREGSAALLPALPVAGLLLVLLSTYSTSTYSMPLPKTTHLTSRIERGPFAGLYTYANRARVVRELQTDLDRHASADDTILFMDDLPAGYLMTSARAAANSAWTPSFGLAPGTAPVLFDYYARGGTRPTLVVTRGPSARREADPLLAWTDRHFEIVANRRGHTLYRLRSEGHADLPRRSTD